VTSTDPRVATAAWSDTPTVPGAEATVANPVDLGGGDGPDDGRVQRTAARRRRRRRRRLVVAAYAAALLVVAAAIPTLGWIGAQAVLESRDGEVADPVLDPTQPGYQAVVPPSPTLLVAHQAPDGSLAGAAVLVLAGADQPGGSLWLLPADVAVELTGIGELTLDEAFAFGGADGVLGAAEQLLRIDLDDVVVLDAAGWERTLAPLGPVVVTNPDEVVAPDGATTFPAGEIELTPAQFGAYLAASVPGEDPLNALLRQELAWTAWIRAVSGDPAAVPGETDQGLGRFVPGLATGALRVATLPVIAEERPVDPAEPADPDAPTTTVVLVADDEAVAALVPELVPFPAGAQPGDRIRVRILDGTGATERVLPVARLLVGAGAQITLVGNADRFDVAQTLVFHSPGEPPDAAEAMAAALGVGTVQEAEQQDEDVDVTVVLGADYRP
jgi:hypothetical protein